MNICHVLNSIKLVLVAGAFALVATAMSTALSAGMASADSMNWDAVAQCESGGNWGADTGNGYYGGLQFKPATWSSNGGYGSPATASREEQIRVAENVLAKQGATAWPTCGSQGGSPALWSATSAPAVSGCQAMPNIGIINFGQMCSAILHPLSALRALG